MLSNTKYEWIYASLNLRKYNIQSYSIWTRLMQNCLYLTELQLVSVSFVFFYECENVNVDTKILTVYVIVCSKIFQRKYSFISHSIRMIYSEYI